MLYLIPRENATFEAEAPYPAPGDVTITLELEEGDEVVEVYL